MKKIAFINQRYGLEVVGGSEFYTRLIAEHLKNNFEIEILTSKALDYVTWENYYQNDVEEINGITVRRFNVEKQRDSAKFNQLTCEIMALGPKRTIEDEKKWVEAQGPFCPDLIKYIRDNKDKYDLFIFVTYLYYPACMGMREVYEKTVFIPTAHDEPYINFGINEDNFKKCRAIIFLTDEEKEFVQKKFNNKNTTNIVTAVGIDMPEDYSVGDDSFKKKYGDYIIYVGRIDESKGCDKLFDYFREYKLRNNNNLKLLLMGKDVMGIPGHEDIVNLGFVSEEDKFAGVLNAKALILPSHFESLSISVLEAFQVETPVIVNGKCEVLKGHCKKSNAGLYYDNFFEFEGCLNYILDHEDIRLEMGKLGRKYVDSYYRWDIVVGQITNLFEKIIENKK